MDKRFWLWLLLAVLILPQMATAQPPRYGPRYLTTPPLKQSHHDLLGGFDPADAQEMMTQRLGELRELHDLQDQVQKLLKDPKFRKQIENLSSADLERLRQKAFKGEGLSQDPAWKQLFQQAQATTHLSEQQIGILRRLAENAEKKRPSTESAGTMPGGADNVPPMPLSSPPPTSSPPPPSLSTPPEPPAPSAFDRLQEETTKWLMEQLDDVGGDMLQTLTEIGGNEGNSPLADLLRSVPQSDFSGLNIREHPLVPTLRAGTFSRYLADMGDLLHRQSGVWDGMGSLFRRASLPSLPGFRGPSVSLRAAATVEGDGWTPALLCLLMLGVIVLLVCKRGRGSKSPLGSGEGAPWRLGSWPVSPRAVSTRQDVIRAFEYLALLCFGPAAAACHHRLLAERLADQDSDNPGRRQAAEMLAWLYEQARYAPVEEALSPEQLSDARQALCFLAGVTAA